jgi:hypothetical protein
MQQTVVGVSGWTPPVTVADDGAQVPAGTRTDDSIPAGAAWSLAHVVPAGWTTGFREHELVL